MKIIINENEVYEIKIPEQIEAIELFKIQDKFNNLAKLISIDIKNPNPPKTYKIRKNRINWCDTKEKTLDVMQYYYHGTREDRERLSKIIGLNISNICKRFHALKKRFNIQPQEVGLVRFGTNKYGLIKIKDYIIKSHTGIFDEIWNR